MAYNREFKYRQFTKLNLKMINCKVGRKNLERSNTLHKILMIWVRLKRLIFLLKFFNKLWAIRVGDSHFLNCRFNTKPTARISNAESEMVYLVQKEPKQRYEREHEVTGFLVGFVETVFHLVVQSGLKVMTIPLFLPSECWVYRCVLPHSTVRVYSLLQ